MLARVAASALLVLSGCLLTGCPKPERSAPADAGSAPPPVASDAPLSPEGFPDIPDGHKLIMSNFGKIVVLDTFSEGETGFTAPSGFTLDAGYLIKGADGKATTRFAISHKDDAGTSVPEPAIADLGDKAAVAAPCPGGGELMKKEFVLGSPAAYRCAKGPFGGGLAATLRKENRVFELLCTSTGDGGVDACLKVLGQYRPI